MIDIGLISENITVDSVRIINGMKLNQKVALCDKIHSEQPYILQELLLLSHTDTPLAKMEHLYHLLMVIPIPLFVHLPRIHIHCRWGCQF